ncbi:trypsin-like peptidase domain-containing protein [Tumebacillus sp. ITR2]|uniref:Trypsin-like peptidase domain-containing protein n=1 Tax=Tumebacillus amylolyticus TaxID=2801339 RepID=A0ABS1JG51_9BACL|nr:trypsin-like peptidase domain-containing protein [Tumebacillus amylolyticus]MBL0389259.1 trypsin-like peptidase domain-containing protein [Tumebacillus amylolyticus]
MKKVLPGLLLGSLLLATTPNLNVYAAAPDAIGLTINNKIVHLNTMPVQQNGRVLVPLRAICEAIGATVEWDAAMQTATITRDRDKVQMTLDSTTAKKNDQAILLDIAPQLINDVTMIPVRALVEGLNLQAKWDETTQTVSIDTHPAIDHTLPPTPKPEPSLSIKEIAKNFDRVVMINIYDKKGELLGSGSGMVVTADGKILTNHHVLAEGTTAKVVFDDGTMFPATKVLLDDPDRDLALMQINVSNLQTVTFGNSDALEIGDNVVAIGSPLGMQNTLSAGLISGLHRKLSTKKEDTKNIEFLQTNAPYTFGSSGGALFDMHGDVIGVTSNAASYMGGELNFAIPSKDVTVFLQQPQTPMTFTEFTKYIADSKTHKPNPNPNPDDEDQNDMAAYDAADQVAETLTQNHPELTDPATGKKVTVRYVGFPSFEGPGQDIEVRLKDFNPYKANGEIDAQSMSDLLQQLTRWAHEAGAVDPLINVSVTFDAKTYNENILAKNQYYSPREDSYSVDLDMGWALLDDATGTITYQVDPDHNHTKQTAKLN